MLRTRLNQLNALLLPNGLQPITREGDLLGLDSYLRNLPMAYDEALDKRRRRSRLVFSRHLANLVPFYGRSRGTGHPGLGFFNRGAEPLVFDPLHRDDRKKNAHMLILGPTGAGKSALLVYLLQQMAAVYRPRMFIIEAGGSFSLLGEHFRAHGISVNAVVLNPDSDVSLPPFADALRLLEAPQDSGVRQESDPVSDGPPRDEDTRNDRGKASGYEASGRDILGEMEIAARVMITGGDAGEDARMSRADRLLIRNAILKAAESVREAGRDQVITRDVVEALHRIGRDRELPEARRNRAVEMGDGMALFCSGLAGHFFNRTGQAWPEADVTLLEMGILAREGYEDQLTVAYLSIMSHINDLVERHQNDERPTLVVTDEGHIITTNPLLARYVVKITKMWRKLGAWFWIATQNLEDFPDASRRMLNMMEWWLCLVMPKEEVEQIARFRELSEEQRSLLLSARKEPGKYVEGVVLSDRLEALFRSVPPPLSLALAMTEKHEKAERARIMAERGLQRARGRARDGPAHPGPVAGVGPCTFTFHPSQDRIFATAFSWSCCCRLQEVHRCMRRHQKHHASKSLWQAMPRTLKRPPGVTVLPDRCDRPPAIPNSLASCQAIHRRPGTSCWPVLHAWSPTKACTWNRPPGDWPGRCTTGSTGCLRSSSTARQWCTGSRISRWPWVSGINGRRPDINEPGTWSSPSLAAGVWCRSRRRSYDLADRGAHQRCGPGVHALDAHRDVFLVALFRVRVQGQKFAQGRGITSRMRWWPATMHWAEIHGRRDPGRAGSGAGDRSQRAARRPAERACRQCRQPHGQPEGIPHPGVS